MPLRTVVWLHGPEALEVLRVVEEELGDSFITSAYAGKIRLDYRSKLKLLATEASRLELGAAINVLDRSPTFNGAAVIGLSRTVDPPPRSWLAGISAELVVIPALSSPRPRHDTPVAAIRVLRACGLDYERLAERIRGTIP